MKVMCLVAITICLLVLGIFTQLQMVGTNNWRRNYSNNWRIGKIIEPTTYFNKLTQFEWKPVEIIQDTTEEQLEANEMLPYKINKRLNDEESDENNTRWK